MNTTNVAALSAAGLAGALVSHRFGLVFIAVGAMIAVGLIPFQLGLHDSSARTCAAVVFAALFFAVHRLRLSNGDDFPGDDLAVMQVAPCAGAYLSLNLRVEDLVYPGRVLPVDSGGWFYWATFVAIWVIPAATLVSALRARDRPLLTIGVVLALGTLATNKPYLGLARQTWDPMLLGALLCVIALAIKRWLAGGPRAQRFGYTAEPVLARDRELLTVMSNATVLWQGGVGKHASTRDAPSSFDGGRSGGAGSSGSY